MLMVDPGLMTFPEWWAKVMPQKDVRLAGRMPGVRCAVSGATAAAERSRRTALRNQVDRHARGVSVATQDAVAADVEGGDGETQIGPRRFGCDEDRSRQDERR
jgi:hypothetical protein